MEKDDLLRKYSPGTMQRFCKDRGECVMGKAPRLSEVADQEGENKVLWWVTEFLSSLARDTVRCKEMPTTEQYDEMASMIFGKYGHLKLTEIMLFFYDCKAAVYDFYGRVDTLSVMSALKSFVEVERSRIISDWDKRQREESRKGNEDETSDPVAAYAFRIRSRDFRGEVGADARKVEDMIYREDFTDERLGNIAREVGEQLIEWWSPVYALRIKNKDYKGKIGETAETIERVIKAGTIVNHWYFGGIERRVRELLEKGTFGKEREPGAGMGKPTSLDEFLLIKAMNGDFEGDYGEAARQKAKEMEEDKDSPF